MELRASGLAAAGKPEPGHLPGDDRQHGKHKHEIEEQHADHDEVGRHDRGEPGQDGACRKALAERQDHDDQADLIGQPPCRSGRPRRGALFEGPPDLVSPACAGASPWRGRQRPTIPGISVMIAGSISTLSRSICVGMRDASLTLCIKITMWRLGDISTSVAKRHQPVPTRLISLRFRAAKARGCE